MAVRSFRGTIRLIVGVQPLAALLLSGCTAQTSPGAAAKAQVEALAPQLRAPFDLKVLDVEALKINASEYALYRSLMRTSGIDADLGGEAAGNAALGALSMQFRQTVIGALATRPRYMTIADSTVPPGYVGGAVAFITAPGLADAIGEIASRDDKTGSLPQPEGQPGDGASRIDGTIGQAEATTGAVFEGKVEGMSGRIAIQMKIDLCPKPDGAVHISFNAETKLKSLTSGATVNTKISSEMTRWVDDDAEFITDQIDQQQRVEYAIFGGAAGANGSYVDYGYELSTVSGRMGGKVNRQSSRSTPADVEAASAIAAMSTYVAYKGSEAAAKAFKSGRCVVLNATSTPAKRNGVKPSTGFDLFAAPRSKIDGSATGGTVKATLSGGSSLDPADTKVKADAKFGYVAPGEKNQKASVAFEARSKRGIGKATLGFDTNNRAYSAVGGGGGFRGSGTICSLSAPFTISGMGVTNTFTPAGDSGGSYKYAGTMSGFSVFGGGSYTVKADETGGTLTARGPGSVKTPMGVKTSTGTEVYTLTPTEPCG